MSHHRDNPNAVQRAFTERQKSLRGALEERKRLDPTAPNEIVIPQREVDEILAFEDKQGQAAELITDLALLETAEAHEANGCDCDFCIGYQIGLKAKPLKARLRAKGGV